MFFTLIGDKVMFSNTVKCGYKLKCWNTKPTSVRILFKSVLESATFTPSTQISPLSIFSNWFTVRISVDLPLPEGPHTTTTSPWWMSKFTLLITWLLPKCLFTALKLSMSFWGLIWLVMV